MKMTPKLSEQANQYLEHLVLNRFIGDRIELLNYRLKQEYNQELLNKIQTLRRYIDERN